MINPSASNGSAGSFDHEDMNAVIRRISGLGWLVGDNVVSIKALKIYFSEKGQQRMNGLVNLLKNHIPNFWENPYEPAKNIDWIKFLCGFALAAPELIVPPFSAREYNALTGLIYGYATDNPNETGRRF
jgi:hypothetical protein